MKETFTKLCGKQKVAEECSCGHARSCIQVKEIKSYNFNRMSYFIKLSFWLYKVIISIFKGIIVPSHCCHLSKRCGDYCGLLPKDSDPI